MKVWRVVVAAAMLAKMAAPAGAQAVQSIRAPSRSAPAVAGSPLNAATAGAALAQKRRWGYLDAEVPDSIAILPPPPAPGSQAQALDRAIYVQTRSLQGSPRWALAAQDAVETPAAVEKAFGCAVGVRLEPRTSPALVRLMSRVGVDAGAIVNHAKNLYQRPRPFIGDASPVCVARSEALAASPSYPSGHATFGWAVGLILAEMAPDRATPILARARAFGESRVVCGVHYASDVEEGRTNGAALVAALHADGEFRTDVDSARRELNALRRDGPRLGGLDCKASDEAAAHTPWAP